MADVFISYHPDSAGKLVRKITETLKKYGISYWYATKKIYAKNSLGEITREIRDCKVFLLILNEGALKSRYVESETALAFRRMMNYEQMTFLPFCVDDCDWRNAPITRYLDHFLVMRGTPPAERIPKLCERVARIVGANPARRPAEDEANRVVENL